MDKFLLVLLLLGVFPLLFFQAEATSCMVCNEFRKDRCFQGKGTCTVEGSSKCRTKNVFIFWEKGGWVYNHSELDCTQMCLPSHLYYPALKVVTLCCKDQDYCNKHQGEIEKVKTH
nr:secreted seminal-vesicle Ly-6 protein 1-like [Microcebus murinus]